MSTQHPREKSRLIRKTASRPLLCALAVFLFSSPARAMASPSSCPPFSAATAGQEPLPYGGQEPEEGAMRHGRVMIAEPFDAGRDLVLTMETSAGDGFGFGRGLGDRRPRFDSFEWTPVQEVPIAEDGSFSAVLPAAPYVRFVARGQFALGIAAFEIGESTDPRAAPMEIKAFVGGEVTLQLRVDGESSAAERSALVGRRVAVTGSTGFMNKGWPEDGDGRGGFSREGVLDEDLRVRFPHLPVADIRISSRGSGPFGWDSDTSRPSALRPFSAPPGMRFRPEPGRATEVVVPLKRGVGISGLVVDLAGEPVAGVSLTFSSETGTPASVETCGCVTGEDGRFMVNALARRPETIRTFAQGFRSSTLDVSTLDGLGEGEGLRVVLDPGRSLLVKVLTPGGEPAQGVHLYVTDPGGSAYPIRSAVTDSSGAASFTLLEGVPLDIMGAAVEVPRDQGSSSEAPQDVGRYSAPRRPLRPGDDRELWVVHARNLVSDDGAVELVLRPAPRIRGVVKGIDPERGAARVIVAGISPHSSRYGLPRDQKALVSLQGDDTEFSIQVPPGQYLVAATQGTWDSKARDMATLRATPHVDVDLDVEDRTVELDFGLAAPLRGQVRFSDGAPAAGLELRVSRMTGGYSDATSLTLTDAKGAFQSTPLLDGQYRVTATDADGEIVVGYGRHDFDPARPEPVNLVARRRGRVQVDCGDDCENVRVASEAHPGHWTHRRGELLEGAGRVISLWPGGYAVALETKHPDGSVTMEGRRIVVNEGAAVSVKLGRSPEDLAKIQGRVLAGSEPVVGIRIAAEVDGFEFAWGRTDIEGRYALAVDQEGPVTLTLSTSVQRNLGEAKLTVSRKETSVQDMLLPTGEIRPRALMRLSTDDWLHVRRLSSDGQAEGSEDLRVTGHQLRAFPFLEDGHYEVTSTDWSRTVTARAEAEVVNGTAVTVELKPVGK